MTKSNVTSCRALIALIAFFLAPSALYADTVTVLASEDTLITAHPNIGDNGGPDKNYGDEDYLTLIGPVAQFQASPLLKFDLSPYVGSTLTDDVELRLQVLGTHSGPETHSNVRLHSVLVDWQEDTVTLNSFGPAPGIQAGIDYQSTVLDSISPLTASTADFVSFNLPANTVQEWIDNPSANKGIIMLSEEGSFNQDIVFKSTNWATGAPVLVSDQLTAIPEPSSLLLLGGLGCAVVLTRRRRWQG